MTTLEQEIYDRFHQLDREAQQRLIEQLQREMPAPFDWDNWITRVNARQSEVHTRIDVVDLLREIREDED